MKQGGTSVPTPRGVGSGDGSNQSASEWTAAFLVDALADGLIDRSTYDRLSRALAARASAQLPAALSVPAMPTVGARPRARHVAVRPTTPAVKPIAARPAPVPAPVPSPSPPSAVAAWFARVRGAIGSDVSVHGLAYLGVLLVFAGTLGFLLFSFGSLARPVRPWAELAVPTVLLGSAAFLRRRGAPMVANAVGVVGGLLLPVVLYASLVDGEPFPPELHGDALGVGVTAIALAVAAAYALVAHRWRDVSVRFLVAPMLWTALWGVGMFLPDGRLSLQEWTAGQFALFTVGVTLTAVYAAARPTHWFALDARPSVLPGALLGLGMTLVFSAAEGEPAWPVVIAVLASLVTSEALAPRFSAVVMQVAQPVLLWVGLVVLLEPASQDVVSPIAVAATVALLEWQTRRRPGTIPLIAAGIGATGGLLLGVAPYEAATWGFVIALVVVAAWAHVRRLAPIAVPNDPRSSAAVRWWVAAIAAVSPAVAAGAVISLTAGAVGYVVLAGILLIAAVAVRFLAPRDGFLAFCCAGWTVLLIVGAWEAVVAVRGPSDRALGGAIVLSAVALAATRIAPWIRLWAVPLALALAGATIASEAGWSRVEIAMAMALVGSLVASVMCWPRRPVVWHLSAAGWALSVGGAIAAGIPTVARDAAIAVSCATVATVILAVADLVGDGRGPMALVRARTDDPGTRLLAGLLTPVVAVIGLTASLLAWCEVAGLIRTDPGLVLMLVGLLGVVLAASTWGLRRWPLPEHVAGDAGVLLSALAAALSTRWDAASTATLAMTLLACVALAPGARRLITPWVGWVAATALVARATEAAGATVEMAALIVSVWAGAIAMGALSLDDALAGRRSYGQFVRTRWLSAPAVVGVAVFAAALVVAIGPDADERAAAIAIYGAAVIALAAWSLRAGVVTVLSYLLASYAAWLISPRPPEANPWALVVWSAVLFLGAWALEAPPGARPLGARWDLPALGVGVCALALAVVLGWIDGEVAATWTLAGVLAVALAWRMRSPWVAATGGLLVFGGAIAAGHAWAAGASLVAAVVLAAVAARIPAARSSARLAMRAFAAAFAAFALVEGWLAVEGTLEQLVAAMLVVAGVATLVAIWLQVRQARPDPATQTAFVAIAAQIVGSYAACLLWPARGPIVASLLVAALEFAAAGLVMRRLGPTLVAPVLACLAWLLAVGELAGGEPMWWTLPIGCTFLVESALTRTWARARDVPASFASAGVALEWVGMLTLLIAPMAQILTIGPARGLIAIGIGLLLAVWGIVTQVRRRLFVGVAAVVIALGLMLVGPIAGFVRQVQGAAVWAALAIAGIALIVVATSLERGRARLARTLERLDELFKGWE